MSAKVVVACGSRVATSEMVAAALEGADAYVQVMSSDFATDVPTVNGVAFLTGMNADAEFKRLLEILGADK